MRNDFYRAIENRRSIYGINKDVSISYGRIEEVINYAIKHTPSAFNSQSSRVVVLFGQHHDQLWNITKETLKKRLSEDKFTSTEEKMNSFKSGYGTVLFFEDSDVIQDLQKRFKSYKDIFPIWAHQSSGMLQYVIWTALELEGLGASLQHYNPIIDDEVRTTWDIPENWKLIAQMPFGNPIISPGEKEFMPINERVKVFK